MLTDEQKKMVEDNLKLVSYIITKHFGATEKRDDYFQIGAYGLCLAVQRFDESKGFEFSTYASRMILGCILRYYRDFEQGPIRPTRIGCSSKTRKPQYFYIDGVKKDNDNENSGHEFIKIEENKEDDVIFDLELERFKRELSEKEIVIMYSSLNGLGQTEIGKLLNISQPQVSRVKRGLRTKFNTYLNI